jgi:hypothetical protein
MARLTEAAVPDAAAEYDPMAQTQQAAALPTIEPNAPWYYAHFAERWQVIDGKVVPDLTTVVLEGGVNRAGPTGDPREVALALPGAVTIPTRCIEEVGSYVRRTQVAKGWHYHDASARLIPGSPRLVVDRAAWGRFLALLVERGIVQPPAPYVAEDYIERIQRDHAAAAREADRDPQAKARAAALLAEIEAWRAVLAPPAEPTKTTVKAR